MSENFTLLYKVKINGMDIKANKKITINKKLTGSMNEKIISETDRKNINGLRKFRIATYANSSLY